MYQQVDTNKQQTNSRPYERMNNCSHVMQAIHPENNDNMKCATQSDISSLLIVTGCNDRPGLLSSPQIVKTVHLSRARLRLKALA